MGYNHRGIIVTQRTRVSGPSPIFGPSPTSECVTPLGPKGGGATLPGGGGGTPFGRLERTPVYSVDIAIG
jgi:hypothetical protein